MVSALARLLLLGTAVGGVLGATPSKPHGRNSVRNVAIIGAGAAGASAAYHLGQYARDEKLAINITVFEKTSHIGGRSLTVNAYDDPASGEAIELGASIFVAANRILHSAALDFGLTLEDPTPSSTGDVTIIWDGEKVVFETTEGGSSWWWEAVKMWWRYGMSPYRVSSLVKTVVNTFLELYEPPFFPFRSLTQRAYELGLGRITGVTGEQFLADYKINPNFCRHILQAATRVNYASNLAHIHGLETMVSFAAQGAVAVRGGNWQIFDKMIEASGAKLYRNASVESIDVFKSQSGAAVPYSQKRYAISVAGHDDDEATQTAYDDIIIATPWQFSNISAGRGVITHKIGKIAYKELHVSLFTSPHKLRGELFGLPQGGTPPSNVYTTLKAGVEADPDNAAGDAGFFSVSTIRTVVHPTTQKTEYLYKLFAPKAVAPAFLDRFFDSNWKEERQEGGKEETEAEPKMVSWYRMTRFDAYPVEVPRVTFQDPVVGRGVYYTSGMEGFISTMETNALMGKNVARLVANEAAGNMGSGGANVNPHRTAATTMSEQQQLQRQKLQKQQQQQQQRQRQDFFQSMENDLDDMMMMDEL